MGEISDALVRARSEGTQGPPERASAPPAPKSRPAEERGAPEPVEAVVVPAPPSPAEYVQRRGVIRRDRDGDWLPRLCAVEPHGTTAVRFRHLAIRARAMLDQRSRQSLLVTSALPGEGKTTIAMNLALALSSVSPEYRIALVDLDLRRGRVGPLVEASPGRGIEHVLSGEAMLPEVCVDVGLPGLDVYSTNAGVRDAHGLLGRAAERLLRALHARYDYVICDGPPVVPVPDVPILAPLVGGCLGVVASGRSRHAACREMFELVARPFWMGLFLNEARSVQAERKYSYYNPEPVEEDEVDVPPPLEVDVMAAEERPS